MKIIKIEPSKHKKGRILLFLDDGTCLKITETQLADFSLHAGEEISPETLERVREAAGTMNVRAKAVELLSRNAFSCKGLVRRLREKGISPEDAQDAVEWLVSLGALNDAAYASELVRQCAEKGYGPARIRSKLYEKGVPSELWEDALSNLPADGSQIQTFLTKKLRGRIPDEKEKRRLTAALLRRGFSWENIRNAWKIYGEELPEENSTFANSEDSAFADGEEPPENFPFAGKDETP